VEDIVINYQYSIVCPFVYIFSFDMCLFGAGRLQGAVPLDTYWYTFHSLLLDALNVFISIKFKESVSFLFTNFSNVVVTAITVMHCMFSFVTPYAISVSLTLIKLIERHSAI